MLCLLVSVIAIIFLFCKKNVNIENFNNFSNNLINRCLESLNLTEKIVCKEKQFCKNDYESGKCNEIDTINPCGENKINEEAVILNTSKADNDIINRRSSNHWYNTLEINSLLNNKTWCD